MQHKVKFKRKFKEIKIQKLKKKNAQLDQLSELINQMILIENICPVIAKLNLIREINNF